jgi:hypothetical protein
LHDGRLPVLALAGRGQQVHGNKTVSGANLLTITGGHTLDVVEAVLGTIVEVDARSGILTAGPSATEVTPRAR